MGQGTASLKELYEPIQGEVERVEALLHKELTHKNPFVEALLDHSMRFQGKRVRPALLLYSSHICGDGPEEVHIGLSAAVEMLHNATLVHDDVLDEAELRRQVKTLNNGWGNEASILFGDYLFAKAYALCAKLHNREANLILSKTVEDICVGELSQTAAKFNFDIEEPQYLEFIRMKTAVLFATACRLGSVGTEADPRVVQGLTRYGESFGMAFQIIDDYLDLTGDEKEMGKSLGTDLAKGKLTLPLIRLLHELPSRRRKEIRELLGSPADPTAKRDAVLRLLHEHDILAYTFRRAQEFLEEAKAGLREAPDSIFVENLATLADFVVSRRN